MATETMDTRMAVVEHEVRSTTERMDRELATKADTAAVRADIEAAKNSMIRWMVGLMFGTMLVQPIVWLGAIAAAKRLGLL